MTRRHIPLTLAALCMLALALPALAGAKARDRNHDRIPDRWEKRHRLSLAVDQARRDQDRDHLRNRAEFEAGTNPRSADSDGDGIPDGEEHAGTIASFDTETGRLTIDLFGGDTVSGLVTEETEIECGGQGSAASASDSNDGEEGSGDDQQGEEPGDQEEPGDDSGGPEEPGDDDGGQEGSGGENGGQESNCTTADLQVGATVHEAELQIENGSAVFEKVELAG